MPVSSLSGTNSLYLNDYAVLTQARFCLVAQNRASCEFAAFASLECGGSTPLCLGASPLRTVVSLQLILTRCAGTKSRRRPAPCTPSLPAALSPFPAQPPNSPPPANPPSAPLPP